MDWWRSYGGRAIELQRFARHIVSLCASSSGYERNWSTFEFVSIAICHLILFTYFLCYSQFQPDNYSLFAVFPFFFVDLYKEKEQVAA